MMNYSIKQQSGAVLIVSLIMLVAMTMVGITSMKSSSTELTMAGNLRESALTFQAAEVGLNSAETLLTAGTEPANTLDDIAADPNYFLDTTWNSAAATVAPVSLANISNNPRFILKFLGEWDPDKGVSALDPGFSGYGLTSTAVKIDYFRATSRGFGQTGNTFRTVQSFFGRLSN
jgi:type IV pilus assembly protein PilX